jgi:4-hydroxybenzoate polyprenyltransferase
MPSKILTAQAFFVHSNTIRLLRIPFSLYLMPVYLLALSQAPQVVPQSALSAFLIIHLLVYPSSNGYNSFVDRDEQSIGGLRCPPKPTIDLYYMTILMDIAAVILSYLVVGFVFSLCVFVYILASRAYSSPIVRLKRLPWTGFVTVTFFQGAFTYYMAYIGITTRPPVADSTTLFVMLAASLQIAGAYPLTQIYQHEEDTKRNDRSLSILLGYRGTFLFSACMFILCGAAYFIYFNTKGQLGHFILLQLFFLPSLIYFFSWYKRVMKDEKQAGFEQTMRMNQLASFSMSACFILLFLIRFA